MLAKVCEFKKQSASEFLKIEDDFAALEIDTACAYRLLRFENERERDRFKILGMMLGGADEDGEIQEDEQTEVW